MVDAIRRKPWIVSTCFEVEDCTPLCAWHSKLAVNEAMAKTVRMTGRNKHFLLKILLTANSGLGDESLSPVASLDMGNVSNVKMQV